MPSWGMLFRFVITAIHLLNGLIYITQLTPLPNINPDVVYNVNCQAIVRATGTVDSVDQNEFTFIMNVAQYTSQDPSGSFPLHAFISEQCK
jgi:hypothetical protein